MPRARRTNDVRAANTRSSGTRAVEALKKKGAELAIVLLLHIWVPVGQQSRRTTFTE